MKHIKNIKQVTTNSFLNMYELDTERKNGMTKPYYVASRAKQVEDLKIKTREMNADGVIIYSIHKGDDGEERVVLIRQYRYPVDDYVYEFPAGLVDAGEDYQTAGARELHEETGLTFLPIPAEEMFTKPCFTTIGMTDEACGTVYGYAHGAPSQAYQEDTEEIQIVLADRKEVRRILKEEKVAIMCAYMMMHFLNSPKGHVFDFLQEDK